MLRFPGLLARVHPAHSLHHRPSWVSAFLCPDPLWKKRTEEWQQPTLLSSLAGGVRGWRSFWNSPTAHPLGSVKTWVGLGKEAEFILTPGTSKHSDEIL